MSSSTNGNNNSTGNKKAVHVKWSGKTIALGTFPPPEADEKCARAKALTRAWRSTMRPKPTREWVMLELERLQVRVVNGRLGRSGAASDSDGEASDDTEGDKAKAPTQEVDSNFADILKSARETIEPAIPPHRPLVGGGSAAAYEAARSDHYMKLAEQKQIKTKVEPSKYDPTVGNSIPNQSMLPVINNFSNNFDNNPNSLGMNGAGGVGGALPQVSFSMNPNQHYEMLKLHHMNLLNEIQETTLMMNLYQQQQLQMQQQQLQQHQQLATSVGFNDQKHSVLSRHHSQTNGFNDLSNYSMGGNGGLNKSMIGGLHGGNLLANENSLNEMKHIGSNLGYDKNKLNPNLIESVTNRGLVKEENEPPNDGRQNLNLPNRIQDKMKWEQEESTQKNCQGTPDDTESDEAAKRLKIIKEEIAARQKILVQLENSSVSNTGKRKDVGESNFMATKKSKRSENENA